MIGVRALALGLSPNKQDHQACRRLCILCSRRHTCLLARRTNHPSRWSQTAPCTSSGALSYAWSSEVSSSWLTSWFRRALQLGARGSDKYMLLIFNTPLKKARSSEQVNFPSSASWLNLSPLLHQTSASWFFMTTYCHALCCITWLLAANSISCCTNELARHLVHIVTRPGISRHSSTKMLEQELVIFTCSLLTRTLFIWAFRYFVQK